jgi:hypothetical protein
LNQAAPQVSRSAWQAINDTGTPLLVLAENRSMSSTELLPTTQHPTQPATLAPPSSAACRLGAWL